MCRAVPCRPGRPSSNPACTHRRRCRSWCNHNSLHKARAIPVVRGIDGGDHEATRRQRRAGRVRRPFPIAPRWLRRSSKPRWPNAPGRPPASTERRVSASSSSDAVAPSSSRATARRSNSSRRRSCGCRSPRAANFASPPAPTARRCWRTRTSSGGRSARTLSPRNCGRCSIASSSPPPASPRSTCCLRRWRANRATPARARR